MSLEFYSYNLTLAKFDNLAILPLLKFQHTLVGDFYASNNFRLALKLLFLIHANTALMARVYYQAD